MGENAACDYLCKLGLKPIDRRYRSPYGELDLIMSDQSTLVFVEVKTREKNGGLHAQFAVTPAKQKRLIKTARCYLGEHPEYAASLIRFDVVTVAHDGIFHFINAFEGTEW